jgi:hypothetical protein
MPRLRRLPHAGAAPDRGYLFVGLFCVMAYFMVVRLRGGADISATATIHVA